ncbi:MAG: putative zinc-binding metallopeptidase [Planctomycetota bacterium]
MPRSIRRWTTLSDDALLDLRFCDLSLRLDTPPLAHRLAKLLDQLDRRGLWRFKPHFWLSTEWFSPDGVPGIAVPFYLAHPRLQRLEQRQMLRVEGGGEAECMRILRHEAGHAVDSAYRLHLRKRWRQLFGSFAKRYPDAYTPKPNSTKFVQHLPFWYAQAHPAEDFAETFAVWLTPRATWRQQYADWPALKKLEYVDDLIDEIADEPPAVRTRRQVEPISRNRTTLREHYARRKAHYAPDAAAVVYDDDLLKLFSDDPKHRHRPTAAAFFRKHRASLGESVAYWTDLHPYTVDQVIGDTIDRCKHLNLRLTRAESTTSREAVALLTVQTMSYVHSGGFPVAV